MSETNKLVTLEHLGMLAARCHAEDESLSQALGLRIDDVVATLEGIVATGGEANILEGIKVNEKTLSITDKIAELLIETGTENGTISVAGANVAIKGLAKLAFLDEITEDEFSDSLKASFAAKATNADLEALTIRVTTAEGTIEEIQGSIEAIQNAGYQTAEQVETIAKAAVAASGHAKFVEAESDPTAEGFAAEENVMYLWPADDGDGYSIYAKVGDSVKLLGHTKVKLTDYSTTEQMEAAIDAAVADKAAMADLNAAVERIAAVEALFASYYTKEEAEEKFTDEAEAQTIAETAASAAVEGSKASTASVSAMLDEEFGSET